MNAHPRRDPFQQWVPTDKHNLDHDHDRRRNRSATLPAHAYPYPSNDARYNDPRHPPRTHRQDPHYPTPSSHSYHHPPATSKAYQHATRQQSASTHHYPQSSSYHPPHPSHTYPVPSSSRRPHPDPPDPRPSRRTHQASYDHLSGGEELPRHSARPSRPLQPSLSAPPNQPLWNPPHDASSSRRPKDTYKDRERDRERDKPVAEPENRYKDRPKPDRHRERERERATDVRYQDSTRSRHYDRRKDSDTEGPLYSEQRNTSKASLSGREGHPSTVREQASSHRRHRTEDGTASTGRRHQPEATQNPITSTPSHSTTVPQPDVLQTGEPPPAPRVMPVYLPPKAKSQRSYRETRPSTAQGAQSGSDTERTAVKHRMERAPSGPAVQRSDPQTSTSTRDRGNHDLSMGPRDDVKRLEGKHGAHQDVRQPLAPINVDIPLVTPGFNPSALPIDTRASAVPQIVSIRAGQGPSDPHDAHFKSSVISHSDAPQEIAIHPLHPTSASIVKSASHARSHSSEPLAQSDRPPLGVEHPRTEPRGDDPPPGQRMSIHESSRALPTPVSRPPFTRGNSETGTDVPTSSYPHSRPPSRSAHRTSTNTAVPPAVVGPRPLRSVSQGALPNEPPTRPPSVTQCVPATSSVPNQHSVSPSPAHQANGSPPKAGHTHGPLPSAQPNPKYTHLHGVSPSHSVSAQQAPPALPSMHPTPITIPQPLSSSSRPSTRDGTLTDAAYTPQQSVDQHPTNDSYPELRHASNNTTVKASWIVQTPATAKRAKVSREDKYLRDHHLNLETPQAQLRQVLSQDGDPFPRTSSSMMKASQATTPSTLSQRNSPGTKARDVPSGTPRSMSMSNSPRPGSTKEAPTPEHAPRQNLPHYLTGPPQIAVVGATPVPIARELSQDHVDHALLVPPFPAPTRVSRTVSSSQDQRSQPPQSAPRNIPSTPYQSQLAPAIHALSLFQPYQPSPASPEDGGQFSPPPLPIPPPRGLEDSPPLPPIETRTSEIISTRSQSDGHPQGYVHSVPEVQSEMFHLPQPSDPSRLSSLPPSGATLACQPGKVDSNTISATISNESVAVTRGDARPWKPTFTHPDDVQIVHQEIMRSTSVLPSQSPVPYTRPRPKVTIEDVSEDSPVLSKVVPQTTTSPITASRLVPLPQHTTAANSNLTSKSVVMDQPGHKFSPQSRNKEILSYRNVEPSASAPSSAPPMPPPTPAAAPILTRVLSSAPPTQSAFTTVSQVAPAQRVTSHVVSSRTYQRASEMLQSSKLSTPAGATSSTIGGVNKSTTPTQTTYNTVNVATGQPQPANGANVHGLSAPKPVSASTTVALPPSASATVSTTKVTPPTTTSSGPSVGTLGLYTSAPSTNINTQPPSGPDPFKHQPSRPGPLLIPSLDTTSANIMSTTTAVKNVYQEQPVIDTNRSRDVMPSATRNLPSSHVYPTSSHPGTSSTTTQQTHATPAQPSTHYRAVSLPAPSSAVQKPPSPRKYSQPISSTTVSTQPFPSRPSAPVSGHLSTPAPVRSARLSPPGHPNDSDVLKTPSSIAPSPMLNPDPSNALQQSMAVPIRTRQASTDPGDDKKKGLFGLFRTRTLSSKAADPLPVSSATRASFDQGRVHPDPSTVTSTTAPVPRGVTSTSAPREIHAFPPPIASTSIRLAPQPKSKGRALGPVTFPPPTPTARDKEPTPHNFAPLKFLTMHSNKRNRTVSAASLDVCDGNTATNTVVGSPDHSIVGQAQPLPVIIPPGIRDPLVATSEWRDREEAERRERKTHRIRRPGVTFDLGEEPPSPAPGTAQKRKKLVRRPSGRAPTPGPPRS